MKNPTISNEVFIALNRQTQSMPTKLLLLPKYGRLTPIGEIFSHLNNRYIKAQCDCGVVKDYIIYSLIKGNTRSCGCYNLEILHSRRKHGEYHKHPLYHVWRAMNRRCYNQNDKRYKNYGGRGIMLCVEWKESYQSFYKWAIDGYKNGLQIDRINNDGNYCSENCRWVTSKENSRNKTNSKLTLVKAREIRQLSATKKYSGKELALIYNIHPANISSILNNKIWTE